MNNFTEIPLNVPLNFRQNQIINMPYRQNWMGRAVAFAKQNPSTCLGVVLHTDPQETAGTLAAGILAPHIYQWMKEVTQISPDTDEARLVSLIALAAFEGLIIIDNIINIKNSQMYHTWKANHIRMSEDQSILDFIKEDDILEHLLCPISTKLPCIPAKNKEGVTYDYSSAVEWISLHPGKPLPGSQYACEVHELVFDYAHINTIIERLYNLPLILRERIYKKISDFVGSKSNSIEMQNMIAMSRICCENGFAKMEDLFGSNQKLKKTLNHIERITMTISMMRWPCLSERKKKYLDEYNSVDISKGKELINLCHLIEKASRLKIIKKEKRSGIVEIFCDLLGIKPRVFSLKRFDSQFR